MVYLHQFPWNLLKKTKISWVVTYLLKEWTMMRYRGRSHEERLILESQFQHHPLISSLFLLMMTSTATYGKDGSRKISKQSRMRNVLMT